MQPMLLRRRSGRTAALVIGLGFGGGTLLLGVGSAVASASPALTLPSAIVGYGIGALPFFILALLVGISRSELWLIPEARTLRMLTYRPWRLGPRIEEAPLSEYAGVRTEPADEEDGGGVLVSLVTAQGEAVALRQFPDQAEAAPYAEKLATAAGLWIRHATAEQQPSAPEAPQPPPA